MSSSRAVDVLRSPRARLLGTAVSVGLAFALVVVAGFYFAETSWPRLRAQPGLLAAAAALSLAGYVLKAYGWRQLFARDVRPQSLALAAANGGAALTSLGLPGRFDDVVRIAVVRGFRRCPADVRTLCLSLGMLGLIDAAALAPLALVSAVAPGHSLGLRVGLVALAAVGVGAAALVLVLPRIAKGRRVLRFRAGRWLNSRTTPTRDAARSWALVSACWLTRAAGLLVLLGALGIGYSITLALLFLCATSAAAALPIGLGGAANQAGAGAAVLIASGAGVSEAVGVAVAVQAVGIVVGGSIFVLAAGWRTGLRVVPRLQPAPSAVRS